MDTMTDDLIKQLRARNDRFQSNSGNYLYYSGGDAILDCEAADALTAARAEIEQLREELAMTENCLDEVDNKHEEELSAALTTNATMKAEIERLTRERDEAVKLAGEANGARDE